MSKTALSIDANNLEAVRSHIRGQFATLSWWPKEAPLQAQSEFAAMQATPEALAFWCQRWLTRAQQRSVAKAVGRV